MCAAFINPTAKFVTAISAFLVMLLVYAAFSKLLDAERFIRQIRLSPLIPNGTHKIVAYAIPATEIIIGLSLCFTRTRRIGLYAGYFLMLLFTLYLYFLLHYSTYIPCSCGGILGKMSWDVHIIFNLAISILTGIACFFEEKQYRTVQKTFNIQNPIA